MPHFYNYECDRCEFSIPTSWGGHTYVIDDEGNRVVCPHPGEMYTIQKVLGPDITKDMIRDRTGFNSDCVCLDCLNFMELDLTSEDRQFWYKSMVVVSEPRDERKCTKCGSENVKTADELVEDLCPNCKDGTIEKRDTGIVS